MNGIPTIEDLTDAVLMLVDQVNKLEKELTVLRIEKKPIPPEVHNPHEAIMRCLNHMALTGGVWKTTDPDLYPWAMWLEYSPTKKFGEQESNFKFTQDDLRQFIQKYSQEQIELRNLRAEFTSLGQVRKSDQDKKVDDKKIQELADCWTGSGLGGLQGR